MTLLSLKEYFDSIKPFFTSGNLLKKAIFG